NGNIIATASDGALGGAGQAGMWTTRAGVVFDDFVLISEGGTTTAPPDLGVAADLSTPRPDLATRPPDLSTHPADLSTHPPDLATHPPDLAPAPSTPPVIGTLF